MRERRERTINELFTELNSSQDKMKWLKIQEVDENELNDLFLEAVTKDNLEDVQFLAAFPGVNPAVQDNEAIRWAAFNGYLQVVQFLASLPEVNPAAQDNEAIRWAAENNHLELTRFLMSLPDVNPAAKENEAIRKAWMLRHIEVVLALAAHTSVTATTEMPEQLQQVIQTVKMSQTLVQNHFTFFKNPGILKDVKREILEKSMKDLQQNLPDEVESHQVIHSLTKL